MRCTGATTVNDQLKHALESRVVIEQAKGFLAARHDLDPDVASVVLRSNARSRQQRLTDVAQQVLDKRVTVS